MLTNFRIIMLAGISLLASSGTVVAQTRPGFEVSTEFFDYSYRERLEEGGKVQDDGTFGGVGLSYVETIGGGAFLRARLNAALGSVDYKSTESTGGGAVPTVSRLDDVKQRYGQLELHLGKDFALGRGVTLTPFVGIGSRYFEDDSGGRTTSDGLAGYDREITYAYVPLGLSSRLPISARTAISLSGQYNFVTHGQAKSRFSRVDPALPDVEVDLTKGTGFEVQAMLSASLGGRQVSFGPFYRRWSIARSKSFVLVDPDGSGEAFEFYEPKNRTNEIGLRLVFGF